MLGHGSEYIPKTVTLYHKWLTVLDGVNLFFVLSGFLIGGILLKTLEKQEATFATLRNFWVARWGRTVPPYLLALLIAIPLELRNPLIHLRDYGPYFFFVQNLAWPHPIAYQEAWSLAVEEHFYLLTPLVIIALISFRLKPRHAVLSTAALILVATTVARYLLYLASPPHSMQELDEHFRKIVLLRLDGLMYGVLAAYIMRYHKAAWEKWRGIKIVVGLLLTYGISKLGGDPRSMYASVFNFSADGLGYALLLPWAVNVPTGKGLIYRTLTHISLISYSVYLLHSTILNQNIILPILNSLHLSSSTIYNALGLSAFWGLTLIAATLMYRYFEVPVIRYRDKLRQARA
jgi:peptidoglycan/LPS O-acetylase OafA/YrhL